MSAGAIIIVFGLLLAGRGLVDMFRSGAVADANRRRNERVRSGRTAIAPTFRELRSPHAEGAPAVRRQGRNLLWFGGATIAAGIGAMMLFD